MKFNSKLTFDSPNNHRQPGYQKTGIRWYPDTRQSDVDKTNSVQTTSKTSWAEGSALVEGGGNGACFGRDKTIDQ